MREWDDTVHEFDPISPLELSAEGRARKAETLHRLQKALKGRRRRRQTFLIVAAALPTLVVAAVFFRGGTRPDEAGLSADEELSAVRTQASRPPEDAFSHLPLGIVRNRAARCAVVTDRAELVSRYQVDDDGLLDFLERANRPDGLVRIDGSVYLATTIVGASLEPPRPAGTEGARRESVPR